MFLIELGYHIGFYYNLCFYFSKIFPISTTQTLKTVRTILNNKLNEIFLTDYQ